MSSEFHNFVTSTFPPKYFPEEDLLLPTEQGGGFFWPMWQELLNGKYVVLRKIGWNSRSSTWLAIDVHPQPGQYTQSHYRAIKVYSASSTQLCVSGIIQELGLWSDLPKSRHLPTLLDHFFHESRTGTHLCLVAAYNGVDVNKLRLLFPRKLLGPPMVKLLIHDALVGVAILHASNIIHANIKASNIVIRTAPLSDDIDRLLHDTEANLLEPSRCMTITEYGTSIVLPIWTSIYVYQFNVTQAAHIHDHFGFALIDLGSAQKFGTSIGSTFYPLHMRSPELLLGADLGWEADMWAIGCLVFELLTGRPLFNPVLCIDGDDLDDLLCQMMEASGQDFSADISPTFRAKAERWSEFFDDTGNLRQRRQSCRPPIDLEGSLLGHITTTPQVTHIVNFIRSCLRLDPLQRVTAKTLLTHYWLVDRTGPGGVNWFFIYQDLHDDHDVSISDFDEFLDS